MLYSDGIFIETKSGPVEYAESGKGIPVLISHGGAGGYDQGLLIGKNLLKGDFRIICPSRFGYLRAPLRKDSSSTSQADIYMSLLDELEIEKVFIIGNSSGGPSAIQFAQRHPERCIGLILCSSVTEYIPSKPTWTYKSDFIFWILNNSLRPLALKRFGATKNARKKMTDDEKDYANNILNILNPISLRSNGIFHDLNEWADKDRWLLDYNFSAIYVPALLIHAMNDKVVPYYHSKHAATKIPNARLISLPDGGHLRFGHSDTIQTEILSFIEDNYNK